jgi:hypothetical protein
MEVWADIKTLSTLMINGIAGLTLSEAVMIKNRAGIETLAQTFNFYA